MDTSILFFFKLTVSAAAIEPIKLRVGVPMIRLMNKIKVVWLSIPRTSAIIGAVSIIGILEINQ